MSPFLVDVRDPDTGGSRSVSWLGPPGNRAQLGKRTLSDLISPAVLETFQRNDSRVSLVVLDPYMPPLILME